MDFWISALQCYLVACKSSEHLSSHPAPSPNRSACRPLWTLVTGPNDWYSDVVGIAATKLGSRLVCLVIKLNTTEHSSWCSYRLWWCHNSEMRLQWMSLVLKKKTYNFWKWRLYPTALPYCSLSRHSRDFGQLPQAISIHDTFYLDLSHMVLALVAMRWDRFHLEAIFNSVDLLKERCRLLSFKVTW